MSHPIGHLFMQDTRHSKLGRSDQQKGKPPPPLETPAPAGAARVDLPPPGQFPAPQVDLKALIAGRRSVRHYGPMGITLPEFAFLLWATQGVKELAGGHATLRTVPSAGARHALETFLLVNDVEGLKPGLYRYMALEHKLAALPAVSNIGVQLCEACLGQEMVLTSAATFFWAAAPYRMTWRYCERGYRYLHLDAGHVCQNLYLAAEGIGCGACAIAAFHDDDLNRALGIDGVELFSIYAATVGRKM
jgi:SagB-type dehydrogenase family enzyme